VTAPVRTITPKTGNTTIRDTSAQDTVRKDPGGRWRKPVALTLVVLLLLGLLGALLKNFLFSGAAVNAERLRFATVERGTFSRDVSAPGLVIAAVSPSVYAQSKPVIWSSRAIRWRALTARSCPIRWHRSAPRCSRWIRIFNDV
jgi:HlyD family secretion protein